MLGGRYSEEDKSATKEQIHIGSDGTRFPAVDPTGQTPNVLWALNPLFGAFSIEPYEEIRGQRPVVLIPNPFYQVYAVAAQAVGASPEQTVSWIAAVSIAKAIGSLLLSVWKKVPMVLAWSTPGAALIAASTGINMNEAVGAFVFAGGLIALTGALPPVNRAVSAIPTGIASGMLAGVLLPFCIAVATYAVSDWQMVLPLIGVFLLVRMVNPLFAVLAALGVGLLLAFAWAGAPVRSASNLVVAR